ncbi:MAG: glucose-1-phosphate thymidylyltransferase RfbA [Peptococcaceae bacterium]|nr:glucose-1-phosphate thymidylyltransferase RfbA [Peptococcaceae bacterium]
MKAIILAGGQGSRLFPATFAVSKQLLPIYDKPMIYYPLSVVMLADIREVLLISTPRDIGQYQLLLGDGSQWGLSVTYCVQEHPGGLAQAYLLGEQFIGNDDVCLVLGDNVFYGMGMSSLLAQAREYLRHEEGGVICAYPVSDATSFGVVEFDAVGEVLSLEEKPAHPRSRFAVPGLYFHDHSVCAVAKSIKPSARGELEITAVNNEFLRQGRLKAINLGRGMAWLDTGTPTGLLNASQFVEAVQSRQGLYIACLEEIAYNKGWIDREALLRLGDMMKATEYGQYVLSLGVRA